MRAETQMENYFRLAVAILESVLKRASSIGEISPSLYMVNMDALELI